MMALWLLSLSNTPSCALPIHAVGTGIMPENTCNRHSELPVGSSYGVGDCVSAAKPFGITEAPAVTAGRTEESEECNSPACWGWRVDAGHIWQSLSMDETSNDRPYGRLNWRHVRSMWWRAFASTHSGCACDDQGMEMANVRCFLGKDLPASGKSRAS